MASNLSFLMDGILLATPERFLDFFQKINKKHICLHCTAHQPSDGHSTFFSLSFLGGLEHA